MSQETELTTDTNDKFRWASWGLLLLRVHAGITIASGGFDKFPIGNWFGNQVAEMGWPLPTFFASAAAYSEFFGGILVVLGLFTRPAAFFVAVTMGVAAFQFHGVAPVIDVHISQLYFWVFVLFVFAGAGSVSLDGLFQQPAAGKKSWLKIGLVILLATIIFAVANSRPLAEPEQEFAEPAAIPSAID